MELVKKVRLAIGMSQSELAEKVKKKKSNYCAMENGKLIPNNLEETKRKAILLMKPVLIQKILDKREELESLEYLLLQLN